MTSQYGGNRTPTEEDLIDWLQLKRQTPSFLKHQLRPARDEWCEFYLTHGHTTKNCRTLKSQIEKLICEDHLSRFMHTQRNTKAKEHDPRLD
ncbi:hypothetical protein CR513_22688, partial [Mucuna pruriens]